MNSLRVFLFLVALRIASVFIVRTWFVPDEYWQSLEVAHHLAFGYGHLTWEWVYGIRSYLHPVLISLIYRLLAIAQLDTAQLLIVIPRVAQALLSATADYRFYRWGGNSKWSLFLMATSWFWFYTASRTLSNTVEASLTTIALSYFPWRGPERSGFLWLVAALTCIRPTAILPWLPLCIHHLRSSRVSTVELLLKRYVPIGAVVVAASVALDSYCHGALLFSPLEFVRFNVWHRLGSHYGIHDWSFYLLQGLPTLLGITGAPLMWAVVEMQLHPERRAEFAERRALLASIVFTIVAYSVLAHKEARFLLALLPMCLHISAETLANWSRKASRRTIWAVALAIVAGNVVPGTYLSLYHQMGTLPVMTELQRLADGYRAEAFAQRPADTADILFLMPCHSTPFFSHMHRNVSMRFLTCEPNFEATPWYLDEADEFYKEPEGWLRRQYPVHPVAALPTHVVMFDVLEERVKGFLANYAEVVRLEHAIHVELGTDERVGQNVLVFERREKEATAAPAKAKKKKVAAEAPAEAEVV